MNTETTLDKDVTAIDTTTAGEGAEAKLPLKLDDSAPVAQSQIDADWEAQQRAEIDAILNGGGGDQPGETPENGTEPAPTPTEPPPAEPPPGGDTPQPPAAQPEARNFEAELAQARLEAERAAYGRMGGELQQLRDEVKRLREQPAQPTPPPPPAPAAEPTDADLSAVLGEKWQDDWGRDGAVTEYKRLQKAAQHFGAAARRSDEDVRAEIRAQLDAERQKSAMDRFSEELEAAVPGAIKLNEGADTNGFGKYLDGYMPGTVSTRGEIADKALAVIAGGATGEALATAKKVVVDVFKGFWAGRTPAQTTQPKPAGTPAAAIDPTKYMMPTTTSGATPPGGEAPARKYTQAQVDALLKQAWSKGDAAYQKVQAWVVEQERLGNVTA